MATIPDSHRDLLDAPVATLATIGDDGRPQLSAVWFLAEGDTLRMSLNTARQKTKNLIARNAAELVHPRHGQPGQISRTSAATSRSLRTTTMSSLIGSVSSTAASTSARSTIPAITASS